MDIFDAKNRRLLYLVIVLFGIIMLLTGMLAGMAIDLGTEQEDKYALSVPVPQAEESETSDVPEQTDEPALQVDAVGKPSILPDTEVSEHCFFSACGHSVKRSCDGEYTGMTQKELASLFPEAEITQFSSKNVVLENTRAYCCPEHYLLKLAGDELHVIKTSRDTFTQETLMRIGFDASGLDSDTVTALKDGVCFDTLSDIDAYIENAES